MQKRGGAVYPDVNVVFENCPAYLIIPACLKVVPVRSPCFGAAASPESQQGIENMRWMHALGVVGAVLSAGQTATAAIESLSLGIVFDAHTARPDNFQGSFFYLNDSIRAGNLLAGQIGYGVWEIDRTGAAVNVLRTNETLSLDNAGEIGNPPIGAKSVASMGPFYFMGASSHAGIARFDRLGAEGWSTASLTPLVNVPGSIESIATDGTLLFTNESRPGNEGDPLGGGRDTIHAYSVTNFANSFTLDEVWRADVNSTITHPDPAIEAILSPRFRGLSHGGNGFLYGVDNGNGGQGHLWAFDASDGTAYNLAPFEDPRGLGENFLTEVINAGQPTPIVPTEYNAGFGAIRRDAPGDETDELLVVTSGGFLRAYDLLDDTTVGDFRDFDMQEILYDAGVLPTPQTRVALFGIAYDETAEFLWLSFQAEGEGSSRRVAGFDVGLGVIVPVVPEPASALLLLAAGGMLAARRRK